MSILDEIYTLFSNMSTPDIIALCTIGVPIFGALIWLIFQSGRTFNRVERVEKDVEEIKTSIQPIPELAFRVGALWESRLLVSKSPRQLNDFGKRVLEQSKIREIVSEKYQQILGTVKKANPKSAYRAEEAVIEAVNELQKDSSLTARLEDGAFNSGMDVGSVLLVGAIDVRDRILGELGFKIEDIDKGPQ